MSFSFIHTGDWQVGKPFGNVGGDSGAELRLQRIKTVERIARLAAEREVDAVLVAGDAFDSNSVQEKTIARTIEALKPFSGTWVFLPGNHDAAIAHSVWTRMREMDLPANVIIADQPSPIELWGGRATILPAPLRRRREVMDQTEWFDGAATSEGSCRIGLAHGSVANRLPDKGDSSNEIRDDRARSAGLCYLALGDWHGYLKIADRTYYSGAPEPDRHKANDSGRIQVVRLAAQGAAEDTDTVTVGHYSWAQLDVEVFGTCDKVIDAFLGLKADPRCCVVSLRVTGAISLKERHRLDHVLRDWDSRVHHLDIDLGGLVDDPTPEDVDALDISGFVRGAAERLKAEAQDPSNPRRDAARMALRMMYVDHVRQSSRGEA